MARNVVFIDPGTSFLRVFSSRKGLVFQEPNVVVVDGNGHILRYGNSAVQKTPGEGLPEEKAYSVRNGAVADQKLFRALLLQVFRKERLGVGPLRKHLVFCTSPFLNSVEKRALFQVAQNIGFRKVCLFPTPLALLEGFGKECLGEKVQAVLDVGGGKVDFSLLGFGNLVDGTFLKGGISQLQRSVQREIRLNWGIDVNDRFVSSSFFPTISGEALDSTEIELKGRDKVTGLPKSQRVSAVQLFPLFERFFRTIAQKVQEVLERLSPDISAEVLQRGILLVGGGGNMGGFQRFLSETLRIPVELPASPETAIEKGLVWLSALPEKQRLQWSECYSL
ncbi:MAG TPA: rod shape-determining protein [Thermotogota bacterium]|nr:rod shape-determining protein [Thermotogota bacterium]HRW91792.1 rod shape-determining protein [Thermotogota bacterium]